MSSFNITINDISITYVTSLFRFTMEANIFILNFSLVSRSSQLGGANANVIKYEHSPVVYVVLDTSYD